MRVFKLILKILLVIVFIFSVLLNALLVDSSNATLLFKHNDQKFKALAKTSKQMTSAEKILARKNFGIQITKGTKDGDTKTTENYYIYVNKKYDLTYKGIITTKTKDQTKKEKNYFDDGYLYTEVGATKSKKLFSEDEVMAVVLGETNELLDTLVEDINTSKEKVKTEFSFSPFYFIGFSYKIKDDNKTTTYSYDLSGKIRKIFVKHKDGKSESYTINYDDDKIKLPDLSTF